jgi:ankyrin repeat protein
VTRYIRIHAINAQGRRYGTALWVASKGGYEQVVKMLLDKGADINPQGERYTNALQAASAGGYTAVVKMLVCRNIAMCAREP